MFGNSRRVVRVDKNHLGFASTNLDDPNTIEPWFVTNHRANVQASSRAQIESSGFRSRIGNRGQDDLLHDESGLGAIARLFVAEIDP